MTTKTIESKFEPIRESMPTEIVDTLASVETIKPVSETIAKEALDTFKPIIADDKISRELGNTGQRITNWSDLYLAPKDAAHEIYRFHKRKLEEKGFSAPGDQCPFLVAEMTALDAERILIDVMEPYTEISNKHLLLPDRRKRYLELIIGLLVNCAKVQGIELNLLKRAS